MQVIDNFKIGDTFLFTANFTDKDGNNLTGLSLECQVRDINSLLLSELTVEELGEGKYIFSTTDTQNWSVGEVYMDIQYTSNQFVASTETIIIRTIKDVTR